jgi:hypothetical protein
MNKTDHANTPSRAPDPIFAVIAEHRAAVIARAVALRNTFGFGGGPPDEPEDSPAHVANQKAYDDAEDREGEALRAVMTDQPTTLAGVAALLEHVAQHEFLKESDLPNSASSRETFLTSQNYCGNKKVRTGLPDPPRGDGSKPDRHPGGLTFREGPAPRRPHYGGAFLCVARNAKTQRWTWLATASAARGL